MVAVSVRRLTSAVVLCLVASLVRAQVSDDAFDVTQGTVVVGCGGGNCENVIGGMLGGAEVGNYICPTSGGVGNSCTVDFETTAPVGILGLRFYAGHDGDGTTRRSTDLLRVYADLDGNDSFADAGEELVLEPIEIPYSMEPDNADAGPNGNRLDLTLPVSATASRWRVEVRYPEGVTGAGLDGPRIIEIDALTPADCGPDSDGDGVGDDCDRCPGEDDGLDRDGDMVPDGCDNCPDDINPGQEDDDADGVGNACEAPAGCVDAPEAGGLRVAKDGSDLVVSFDPIDPPQTDGLNLHAGTLAALAGTGHDHAARACNLTGTSYRDVGAADGPDVYYVVAGHCFADGEGSYGTDSLGAERPTTGELGTAGCP